MGSRFAEDAEVCLRDVDADQAQARGERDEQGCLGTSLAAAEAVHVADQGCPGASAPAARAAATSEGCSGEEELEEEWEGGKHRKETQEGNTGGKHRRETVGHDDEKRRNEEITN